MMNWNGIQAQWRRLLGHVKSIGQEGVIKVRSASDLEEIALADENQAIAVSQVEPVNTSEQKAPLA